jgi:hypothetical protein
MNFDYNDLQIENCKFRISPSQISKFFSYPPIWYKDNILGEKDFTDTTATVLGTIIHAALESYALKQPVNKEEIESHLIKMSTRCALRGNPIDIAEIRSLYPDMIKAAIDNYLRHNPPTEVEQPIYTEIMDGIYVGGSCDNRTDGTIVDYKNVSTKPNTDTIPFEYKIQLLAYAYIYKKMGISIDRIRLVYTVRPTKTLHLSSELAFGLLFFS